MAAGPVYAEEGRDKPADGREEGESLVRFPRAAVVAAEAEATPVKGVATATSKPVHQQTKDGEPAERDDEVDGPVDEASGEGEQPQEGQQDGEPRHNLSVDEAAQGPGGLPSAGVKVVSGNTSNDGTKDQLKGESAASSEYGLEVKHETYLRKAEYHRDKIGQDHFDMFVDVGQDWETRITGFLASTALQSRRCGGWESQRRQGGPGGHRRSGYLLFYYFTYRPAVPHKSHGEWPDILLNGLQASLDQSQSHPRSRPPGMDGCWASEMGHRYPHLRCNRWARSHEAIRMSIGYLSSHQSRCLTL